MEKIIELQDNGIGFRLEILNKEGWCEVFFINSNKISLGKDCFQDIRNKLLNYLYCKDDKNIMGHYNGYELYCILMLFVEHATLYGTKLLDKNNMKIFVQRDRNNKLLEINLNEKIIKKWIEILEENNDI